MPCAQHVDAQREEVVEEIMPVGVPSNMRSTILLDYVVRIDVGCDLCAHRDRGKGHPTSVCPSGYLKWDCKVRPPTAATVKVPTSHKHGRESTNLPAVDIGGDAVLKPTVPMALTCSKARSKGAGVGVQHHVFGQGQQKNPDGFRRGKRQHAVGPDRSTSLMVRLKICTWSARGLFGPRPPAQSRKCSS